MRNIYFKTLSHKYICTADKNFLHSTLLFSQNYFLSCFFSAVQSYYYHRWHHHESNCPGAPPPLQQQTGSQGGQVELTGSHGLWCLLSEEALHQAEAEEDKEGHLHVDDSDDGGSRTAGWIQMSTVQDTSLTYGCINPTNAGRTFLSPNLVKFGYVLNSRKIKTLYFAEIF